MSQGFPVRRINLFAIVLPPSVLSGRCLPTGPKARPGSAVEHGVHLLLRRVGAIKTPSWTYHQEGTGIKGVPFMLLPSLAGY